MTLLLHSYGKSNKETSLSYAEIASEMGVPRPRAVEAIKELLVRKIVLPPLPPTTGTEKRTTHKNTYKIQKDYQQWGGTEKRTRGEGGTEKRTRGGTEKRTTKLSSVARTRAGATSSGVDVLNSNQNKEGRFVIPTFEQVKGYCQERKNNVDPQQFIDFYTAKGWFIGKNKMKNWQAAVRTWEQRHPTPKVKDSLGDLHV